VVIPIAIINQEFRVRQAIKSAKIPVPEGKVEWSGWTEQFRKDKGG